MIKQRSATRKNKRQLILEKAIEIFAEKGSQQTTIADIAKNAGIAQGTVYVYFSSKEELLNECMQEIIDYEMETIIQATAGIADTMDRLYSFFVAHVNLVIEKPFVARFLTMEARQNDDYYTLYPDFNPLKRYLDYVKGIAREAIAEKRIRELDIDAFAYMVVGMMDFAMAQWLVYKDKLDILKLAASVRDILKYGVNES
ncbi:MAG: TetR/AcrR family transcriptional regulator [Candidatus Cloacimonetes bacterium]|nr:TetR/AcrR family transcriptional regulator [Candidatus Cloacimonadota bacterium]